VLDSAQLRRVGRHWRAAVAAGLVVAGYAGTLDHPFLYDDRTTVLNNPSLRHLANLHAIVAHDPKRPVVNFSYALDYAISGGAPAAFHVTSLLIHVVNVLLLYGLALMAFADARARRGQAPDGDADARWAGVAALLFAVHPMLTEAVGYVSGRSGLLATTFVMLGIICLRRGWTWRALAAWLAGLLSKETAALLPLVFLAYDLLLLDAETRRRRILRVHAPLIAIVAAASLVRLVVFARYELSGLRPLSSQALTQLGVFWRYISLFAWPRGQSIAHSVRLVETLWDPVALPSLAALILLIAVAWRVRSSAPVATFGVAWLLLLILPSSLIPLAEHMSEHRTYEASAGIFLVVAAAWQAARAPLWLTRATTVALASLLLYATVTRNAVWADPVVLWQDGTRQAPDLWTAHYALANEYQHAGECAEALPEYQTAMKLHANQRTLINIGTCLAQLGRLDDARRIFETALRLGPGGDAHFNLALLDAQRGDVEGARAHLRAAVALDDKQLAAREALANLDETVFRDGVEMARMCTEIAQLAPGTPSVEQCSTRAAALIEERGATTH
jgi:protein O-mannosyl-transferase